MCMTACRVQDTAIDLTSLLPDGQSNIVIRVLQRRSRILGDADGQSDMYVGTNELSKTELLRMSCSYIHFVAVSAANIAIGVRYLLRTIAFAGANVRVLNPSLI
jgi:hypothetical protein